MKQKSKEQVDKKALKEKKLLLKFQKRKSKKVGYIFIVFENTLTRKGENYEKSKPIL